VAAAPELPRAAGARSGPGAVPSSGAHGGPGAALSREAGAVVLTWCLYARVPSPQGTDILLSRSLVATLPFFRV
jgi:hypothetical protein